MARSSTLVAALLGAFAVALVAAGALLLVQSDDDAVDEAVRGPARVDDVRPMDLDAPAPREVERRALPAPGDDAARAGVPARGELGGRIVRLADATPIAARALSVSGVRGRTDADGRFALRGVPSDARTLSLAFDDGEVLVALPADTGGRTDLRLVADTGWVLAGDVSAREGGPAREARVHVPGGASVDVDAAGRFVLRDVRPPGAPGAGGAITLLAGAPWHVAVEQAVRLSDERRVVDDLAFVLDGAGRIEGRLLLPGARDDWPSLEVAVPFRHAGASLALLPFALRASFDGDRYVLDGVPEGTYLVRATPGARGRPGERTPHDPAPLLVPWVLVVAGRTTALDLRFPAGARLTGRVRDDRGAPIVGARVRPVALLRWPAPEADAERVDLFDDLRVEVAAVDGAFEARLQLALPEAAADDAGAFDLARLPAGELLLEVDDPARAGVPPSRSSYELAEGEARDAGDLVLGAGLRLSGRLVDVFGRPLAGRVVLLPAEGAASIAAEDGLDVGVDGAFELLGLEPGARRLWAASPGHVTRVEDVRPGGAEVLLTLEEAPRLSGLVRDASSGEPLGDFTVTARSARIETRQRFDAPDGRFVFDTLDDDEYALTVSAPGYEDGVVEGVRPVLGGGADVLVELRPVR
ncbi:MAG: carboxypeptidase regulatory-like domain-containing protein [Planctomycetes bacterium]|nr:carboxypeptidase regulatory-like domain-containing protein [Planctomycetota bacterium]